MAYSKVAGPLKRSVRPLLRLRTIQISLLVVIVATMVAGVAPAQSRFPVDEGAEFQWVGRVRCGMSLKEMQEALGEPVVLADRRATDNCVFATLPDYKWWISWMLVDGKVVCIEVTGCGFRTARAVQVGDSESVVLERYKGRVKVEPDPYDPRCHALTVESLDHQWAVVFKTDGSLVKGFRVGHVPEVLHAEGCQ